MLRAETIESSSLYNKDLAPVPSERRTWRTYNYAALWISMSVNIPTYMLASGMIAGSMNWKQALFTVFLGNVLVLIPMLLNAHAGAQYGIPFPVFARASFGVLGANVPAILRALVACGWFGIQTWIGGEAINAMIVALAPPWANFHAGPAICFAFFWLLNVLVILRGIETIRFLQGISAPFLLLIGLALLLWARGQAGGFGPMLSTPSKFQTFGEFFRFFVPSLTGVVGFWATVSLNIPDFTRYARSQRDQIVGQALGLPATMTFYSFIGIAVTSATLIIFGEALWNPVAVLARLGNPFAIVLAMIALLMATLNVNVAANVVSPANDFSNLSPRRISFRTGGLITCAMGIVMQPWKLMADYGSYIFGWLVGYSGFLGPIAGVLICDYFVVRKKLLIVEDLYQRNGQYEYSRGFNWTAVAALAAGVAIAFVGLLYSPLRVLYNYAWFVGFLVSFVSYFVLTSRVAPVAPQQTEEDNSMDFGITIKPDISIDRILSLTRHAESSGFSFGWIFDSHVIWKEPFPLLTLMASNTKKMRLGTCVTNPAVRDVTVSASLFATLNLASHGRMELGIGRGDSSRRVLGKKPTTLENLEEFVRIFRNLNSGKMVELDGVPTKFPWANGEIPRVWVAGYGPKALRTAGRIGDGVILQFADPDLIDWCLGFVREGAKEAGRDFSKIEVMSAAPVWASDNLEDAREHVRWFPALVSNHVMDLISKYKPEELPPALTSFVKDRGKYDYLHHCEVGSDNADFVSDEVVDRFCIIGPIDEHRKKLDLLRKVGVTQFNIYLMCGEEEKTLDVYQHKILPHYKH